jgi:hypothetical protein
MADPVIFKYPLGEYPGLCTQAMPEDAQVVHAGQQCGIVTVWALVDPDAPKRSVTLRVVATGEPFDGYYLGTALMPNGLVWHVVHGRRPTSAALRGDQPSGVDLEGGVGS